MWPLPMDAGDIGYMRPASDLCYFRCKKNHRRKHFTRFGTGILDNFKKGRNVSFIGILCYVLFELFA